jgi:hypothetical protein
VGNPRNKNASALRVLAALLIVGCFALGGTLAGAVLYVRHVFQTTLTKTAQAAGLKLTLGDVNYGLGFIQLFNCHFDLVQVPGVSGNIKRIDVDLAGTSASKLLFSGLTVYAKGEPLELYRSLSKYATDLKQLKLDSSPDSTPPVVELKHLEIHATLNHPVLSNLDVTELHLNRDVGAAKDQTTLTTATSRINNVEVGPLAFVFRNQEHQLELGWGKTLEESSWTLVYRDGTDGTGLAVAVKPMELGSLLTRLGQTAPLDSYAKASLGGTLSAHLDPESAKLTGKLSVSLTGIVPPLPEELKGYTFKNQTELLASFESDVLFTNTEITVLQLNNGAVRLLGNGQIERTGMTARLRADLSTQLDCGTLAQGYTSDALGGSNLGQWAQRAAAKSMRGSVAVRVQLDADSANLADAKVVKKIGVGCGLKPLSVVELLALGLPPPPDAKTAERVAKLLTTPSRLPSGASLLPSLHELITLDFKRK